MQTNSTTYTLDIFIVPYGVDRQQKMRRCNECDVTGASHVSVMSHVAEDCHVPVLAWLPVTVDASYDWQSCDSEKYI
jgi:hypothetical protein